MAFSMLTQGTSIQSGPADDHFLEGEINQDQVAEFLKMADVFARASFAEGIPVALMEAMAMEIPCVSTMIASIPELIKNDIDELAGRLRVISRCNLKENVRALEEVDRCLPI